MIVCSGHSRSVSFKKRCKRASTPVLTPFSTTTILSARLTVWIRWEMKMVVVRLLSSPEDRACTRLNRACSA